MSLCIKMTVLLLSLLVMSMLAIGMSYWPWECLKKGRGKLDLNKNDLKREGEINFEQDLRMANDPRVKLLSASCDRKLLLKKKSNTYIPTPWILFLWKKSLDRVLQANFSLVYNCFFRVHFHNWNNNQLDILLLSKQIETFDGLIFCTFFGWPCT